MCTSCRTPFNIWKKEADYSKPFEKEGTVKNQNSQVKKTIFQDMLAVDIKMLEIEWELREAGKELR